MSSMKSVLAALVGFVLGALFVGAIHDLLAAGEASKNKRSLAEARNILDALQRYRAETGEYPRLDADLSNAKSLLVPKFTTNIWQRDVYNRPYIIFIDRTGPVVVSTGRNGFAVRTVGVELPADGSLGK